MGVVYRARERVSGREVALKLLKREPDERQRARFLREGELTARLTHPGILRIHSAGEIAGQPYLAYELIEGARTLGKAFSGLELPERVELVRDAARALGHAHAHGVLHRDVKPDNILVDQEGRVRVADFGLAGAADLDRLTRTGVSLGTPFYMAPEQLAGRRELVGPPADVWSLGVVLFEALTGELPFPAEGLHQLIDAVMFREVPRPRASAPEVPRALEDVCLKCLAREPEARYAEAAALADDLERALHGRTTSAHGGLLQLPRRAGRLLGAGAALAVVALAAALGLAVFLSGRQPAAPQVTLTWEGASDGVLRAGGGSPIVLRGSVRGDVALSDALLLVNGAVSPLDPEGRFRAALDLPEGGHVVEAVLRSRSAPEAPVWIQEHLQVLVDRIQPALEVLSPLEGTVTAEDAVRIDGRVSDPGGACEVEVGGRRAAVEPAGGGAQRFVLTTPLKMGPNLVRVRARDPMGNVTEVVRRVQRVPAWLAERPPAERPPLPLPEGLRFGDRPGEYVNERDGSVLLWILPPETTLFILGGTLRTLVRIVEGYFLGKYEVTWAQFERYCEQAGLPPLQPQFQVTGNHPVHGVTWDEATAYCAWAGLRLPTEVEWENAARGSRMQDYPWGDRAVGDAPRANVKGADDGFALTSPVGSFPAGASSVGCDDLAGNLFEWVEDWFAPLPVHPSSDPPLNYRGPPSGEKRVVKGGGYDQPLSRTKSFLRWGDVPERRLAHTGFRVARAAR